MSARKEKLTLQGYELSNMRVIYGLRRLVGLASFFLTRVLAILIRLQLLSQKSWMGITKADIAFNTILPRTNTWLIGTSKKSLSIMLVSLHGMNLMKAPRKCALRTIQKRLFLGGMILKRKGGKSKQILTLFFNVFFNETWVTWTSDSSMSICRPIGVIICIYKLSMNFDNRLIA